MKRLLLLVLLAGCAHDQMRACLRAGGAWWVDGGHCYAESRIDWEAVDRGIASAAWKTDHCASWATREQCQSLFEMHEAALRAMGAELDAIARRNREAFEAAHCVILWPAECSDLVRDPHAGWGWAQSDFFERSCKPALDGCRR